MSSDDDMLLLAMVARRRRRRRKVRVWVHPYLRNADSHSPYIVSQELLLHPEKFQSYYRMEIDTFKELVNTMKSEMQLQDTNYRRAVGVEERLLIFLRYLATGQTFTSLSFEFYRGISTISNIVADTAKKVWSVLQPTYMPLPTQERWMEIRKRFYELWNIPNCLGCLDGKHVAIKCPFNSGSAYYNYQGYFSVVLMACVDADACFTWISVGDYGRNSDGRVILSSGFYQALEGNKLNIPPESPLPNDELAHPFPNFFIGDQAFPLRDYLLRPYPTKTLDDAKRVFNYRLSRPRKSVECAFGMLGSKFRLFLHPIECQPDKVTDIVKAACILHNYIRLHDGMRSTPTYEQEVSVAYEKWLSVTPAQPSGQKRAATHIRNHLCNYFMKKENALPYQNIYN